MKRHASLILCLILTVMALSGCAGNTAASDAADNILYGKIITMDEKGTIAEAVAIKDGKIIFVGNKADAEKYIDDDTGFYEFSENCIYPGFVDGHSHIGIFATMEVDAMKLELANYMRQNAESMKTFIEENPGKEVYVGSGFWTFEDDPDPLTHEVLDKYASDQYPIVIIDAGGHSALLNQKAIEHFHIADLIDVYGTDGVKVDDSGAPTGYLVETSRFDLMNQIPISKDALKEFFLQKQDQYITEGYTTICDADLVETEKLPMVTALKELADEGKLKLKIRGLYEISETAEDPLKEVDKAAALAKECNNDYFKLTGIKVFIDGVPEALTSWTEKPYTKEAGKGDDYHGYIRWNEDRKDELASIVRRANENGLSFQMHAMGEAGVHYALDVYEKAHEGMNEFDFRNGIAHVAAIDDADLKRFAENKVIPYLAPQWSTWKVGTKEHETEIYGEEDALKMYKIKSFIDAGAIVSFHSDGMCPGGVPEIIYSAATRKNPIISTIHNNPDLFSSDLITRFPEEVRGKEECISGAEAVKCFTNNSAYSMKEEDVIGSIEVGKAADFTIYTADFTDDSVAKDYTCAEARLLSVISNGTMVWPVDMTKK